MDIVKILMTRDGMSEAEANDIIEDAKSALADYLEEGNTEDAYNICEEFFGLEPDYLEQLI